MRAKRILGRRKAGDGAEAPERLPPEGGTPTRESRVRASPSEFRLQPRRPARSGRRPGSASSTTAPSPTPATAAPSPIRPTRCRATRNSTTFEYIRDHLGYRLEAQQACFDNTVQPGGRLRIELTLVNRGFAAPVNPRELYFVLGHGSGEILDIPTGVNAQTLQPYRPGDPTFAPLTHRMAVNAVLPAGLPAGEWTLALWMPDSRDPLRLRADYAIRLANNLAWCDWDGRGVNRLGTLLNVKR